jgi:two-component system, OmpR family, response regulator CpxR
MSSKETALLRSILLIDDDMELCALMTDYFAHHGFRIESAHDGRDGLGLAFEKNFDLIILDVMLPVLDGFEVLRQIRKRSRVPVIMLTARTAQSDRVAGLDSGADDYLPKPFEPEELLARIGAVLRRAGTEGQSQQLTFEAGGVKLNLQTRQIWNENVPIQLTAIEFDILELLIRAAGRIVSRDELTAVLYQRRATPFERSIDVHISHLRKKLKNQGRPLILTIRGVGYLLSPKSWR